MTTSGGEGETVLADMFMVFSTGMYWFSVDAPELFSYNYFIN